MFNITLSDFDTCPLDDMDNASYVVACTILDHRVYTDKSGADHKNQKKLLVAKGTAKEALLRQLQKRGTLQFCLYEAARSSKATSNNTGNLKLAA